MTIQSLFQKKTSYVVATVAVVAVTALSVFSYLTPQDTRPAKDPLGGHQPTANAGSNLKSDFVNADGIAVSAYGSGAVLGSTKNQTCLRDLLNADGQAANDANTTITTYNPDHYKLPKDAKTGKVVLELNRDWYDTKGVTGTWDDDVTAIFAADSSFKKVFGVAVIAATTPSLNWKFAGEEYIDSSKLKVGVYTWLTHRGDEAFWYCYLKNEPLVFAPMFVPNPDSGVDPVPVEVDPAPAEPAAANLADTLFPAAKEVNPSDSVDLIQAAGTGNKVWFAPNDTTTFKVNGTTMTSVGGATTKIAAPTEAGYYRLFVINDAGTSKSSKALKVLTVDPAPAEPAAANLADTLFPAAKEVNPSDSVDLIQAAGTGNKVWFAPNDTTTFKVNGTTMTSVGGATTKIAAPTEAGYYRLFVINDAGTSKSSKALKVLTVDPAPTETANSIGPDDIFPAAKKVAPGVDVALAQAAGTGNKVWFAPNDTTEGEFAVSDTVTKAGGTDIKIAAPKKAGKYRLFVRNDAGTSAASTAVLTVDASLSFSIGSDDIFPAAKKVAPGVDVALAQAAGTGNKVYFTQVEDVPAQYIAFPESDILTSATGAATTIKAPTRGGKYHLFMLNSFGVTSAVSKAVLTVDTSLALPTNQDYVFPKSLEVAHDELVGISPSGGTDNEVWFAPLGTKNFAPGNTMTKAGGNDSIVNAPKAPGTYYLYVRNSFGTSKASTAKLIVK